MTLLSISADEDERAWRSFIADKNMSWPQCRDTEPR